MNERYIIIKKLYSNYIIYIKKKRKYILYGIDKEISNYFDISSINKLYLDNLDIETIEEYENNNYKVLEKKIKLIKIINLLRKSEEK